jgi:membrane protease YdiL (CAAX protease family)
VEVFRPWRISDAGLVFVAGLAAATLATVALGGDLSVLEAFGVVAPVQAAATLTAAALLARERGGLRQSLGSRFAGRDSWGLLEGAALQIGLSVMVYLVVELVFDVEVPTQEVAETADKAATILEGGLVIVGAVVLAPLAEEVLFRGVLLSALRGRVDVRRAVTIQALVFGALHMFEPGGFVAGPVLMALGLALGHQVVHTGRLGRAILTHVGFNLSSVLLLFIF